MIRLTVHRTLPVASPNENNARLNVVAAEAKKRVMFVWIIPHHPDHPQFFAARNAPHARTIRETHVAHANALGLKGQRGLLEIAEACGAAATHSRVSP
jgi:hypothetical protein